MNKDDDDKHNCKGSRCWPVTADGTIAMDHKLSRGHIKSLSRVHVNKEEHPVCY